VSVKFIQAVRVRSPIQWTPKAVSKSIMPPEHDHHPSLPSSLGVKNTWNPTYVFIGQCIFKNRNIYTFFIPVRVIVKRRVSYICSCIAINASRGLEVQLHTFLYSTLVGGVSSVLRNYRFRPEQKAPPLHIEWKTGKCPEAGLSTREGINFTFAEIETRVQNVIKITFRHIF
jgi:hypothetical protein